MSRISIPVLAVGGAEVVRVWYALTPDDSAPPPQGSHAWLTLAVIPAGSLPTTVHTPPLPQGAWVWTRASGETAGIRVTNYTTPVATEVPVLLDFLELALGFTGDHVPVLTWAPGPGVEGVRILSAVAPPQDVPELLDEAEVDADEDHYEFGSPLPVNRRLTVEATAFPGWTGSEVTGEPGVTRTLSLFRAPAIGDEDLACRLLFTVGLDPVLTEDLCLVTTLGD